MTDEQINKLNELGDLLSTGAITKDEFNILKAKVLNQNYKPIAPVIPVESENAHKIEFTGLNEVNSALNSASEIKDLHHVNELKTTKTSPSFWRYILAIIFFISGGYYIAYKLYFQEKWANEHITESQQSTFSDQPNSQPSLQDKVSMDFIGQTYVKRTKDSFGGTTEQFSFLPNGKGEFYVAFSVVSSFYELDGPLTWKIDGNKIHMEYTYIASDGVSTREKELLTYDEQRNLLLDDNDNTKVYKSISSKSGYNHESSGYNESSDKDDYYNSHQAEHESNQNFYDNNNSALSKVLTSQGAIRINYGGKKYLFFPKSMNLSDAKTFQNEIPGDKGIKYRLPSFKEMKALFVKESEVGTGYYKDGKYYKAKMPEEFDRMGEAVWFWISTDDGQYCLNMFNGVKVNYENSNKNFPVFTILIGEDV